MLWGCVKSHFTKSLFMNQTNVFFCILIMASIVCSCTENTEKETMTDHTRLISTSFKGSEYIGDRAYHVYLPPSYEENTEKNYPVLYMMDGQNLFIDSLAYGGFSWRINQVADSLVEAGAMKEIIIVGIDNAGVNRFSEYMPQKPVMNLPEAYRDSVLSVLETPLYADDFLQFLVKELKPQIDADYRTLPDTDHTFIGGSSMGGLISMYAQCEYPGVFGGALCFSTHWPVSMDDSSPLIPLNIVEYFSENVPGGKTWYFDHGTRGLDQYYEPYQQQIDSILMEKQYIANDNWMSRKFEGHDHNERDWHRRLHIPLTFVFGKNRQG